MTSTTRMFERGREAAVLAFGSDQGGYVCPICLIAFDDPAKLSQEHAPPQRVGGTVVALTCKTCNSAAGAGIDHHLAGREDYLDFLAGRMSGTRDARLEVGGISVRAEAGLTEEGLSFTPSTNRNHPAVFAAHGEAWNELRPAGGDIKFSVVFNYRKKIAEVGWVRSAYLVAFAALGYRYIVDERLDIVRRQIDEPGESILNYSYAQIATADPGTRLIIRVEEPHELASLTVEMGRHLVFLPAVDPTVDTYARLAGSSEFPPEQFQVTGKGLDWPMNFPLGLDFGLVAAK